MKYATWTLSPDSEGKYFYGPESAIESVGGTAQSVISEGPLPSDTILGKFTGDISTVDLTSWVFTEISYEQAVAMLSRIYGEPTISEINGLPVATLAEMISHLD